MRVFVVNDTEGVLVWLLCPLLSLNIMNEHWKYENWWCLRVYMEFVQCTMMTGKVRRTNWWSIQVYKYSARVIPIGIVWVLFRTIGHTSVEWPFLHSSYHTHHLYNAHFEQKTLRALSVICFRNESDRSSNMFDRINLSFKPIASPTMREKLFGVSLIFLPLQFFIVFFSYVYSKATNIN